MLDQTISHYRILRKLGAGGMGEVYVAQDTKLGREVALKFLPASFQYDPERRARFLREARAASALHSPNIAAIHDIEEHEGLLFIVMEYVEGEPLSHRIERGALGVTEAIDIAAQIAEALDEAHSRGIVHRDIKGSNLMITGRGLVKMLDFGIAKMLEGHSDLSDGSRTLTMGQGTAPGVVLGTASYMSPEQARGLRVDARTDLFSVGVVMYEMLAGRLPFEGATPTDVMAAILHYEPPPLSRYSPEIPEALEWIVTRTLRKNADERYQTAKELAADLKALKQRVSFEAELSRPAPLGSAAALTTPAINDHPTIKVASSPALQSSEAVSRTTSSAEYIVNEIKQHKNAVLAALVMLAVIASAVAYLSLGGSNVKAIDSLAVLPFLNEGADFDTDYLSDGLAESLINSLSQLPNLKLMSRNSVFRYKGREVDAQTAGRELKVKAVLTGRMVQRGDRVGISAELIDVQDNSHIWGERYDVRLSDLPSIQQQISTAISERLKLKLTGEQQKRLLKRDTENTEAYQLYLKGRYHWNKRTPVGLKTGVEFFQQAIEKDAAYALAYSGLADCYNLLNDYNVLPPREAAPKAIASASRALEIDESLAEAHTSLAFARMRYDWDWPGAEKEFKRAIELNPNYSTAHHWYGLYLATLGRYDEALAEMNRALELDPLSLIISTNVGWVYYFSRQYDRAITAYRKTLEMDPTFVPAHVKLGWAFEQKGMFQEALIEAQKRMNLLGDSDLAAALAAGYSAAGYKGALRKWVEKWKSGPSQYYVAPYSIAQLYGLIGDADQALVWLEKAYEDRDGWLVYLKVEPAFDGLRSDARFVDLLRRVGLTQ